MKTYLDLIKQKALICDECPELVKNRTNVVFGEGNQSAKIMFIGEAGGRTEDEMGRPFVGASGKLLDNIIKACGWKREDVYICNCICCRPPNNREPTKNECENCRPFLDAQIKTVNPEFIILLGTTASGNILNIPVSRARGSIYDFNGIKTIATYHPSYLLRSPSKKKDVWEDLQVVIKSLRQDNHENN